MGGSDSSQQRQKGGQRLTPPVPAPESRSDRRLMQAAFQGCRFYFGLAREVDAGCFPGLPKTGFIVKPPGAHWGAHGDKQSRDQ